MGASFSKGMFTKSHHELICDLVFSCNVCGKTMSEVYKDAEHGYQLSDDLHDKTQERLPTKLWLGCCTHVFCGEHLEGGGVTFHRSGDGPKGVCPTCHDEEGRVEEQALFHVRGAGHDEHHPAIPNDWFKIPQELLTGDSDTRRILRFQYSQLCRFAITMHDQLEETQKQLSVQKRANTCLEVDLAGIEERIASIKKIHTQWPALKHCLDMIPELVDENIAMRHRLKYAGLAMPSRNYALESHLDLFSREDEELYKAVTSLHAFIEFEPSGGRSVQRTTSSRTLVESPARIGDMSMHHGTNLPQRGSSRDLMPPPPPRRPATIVEDELEIENPFRDSFRHSSQSLENLPHRSAMDGSRSHLASIPPTTPVPNRRQSVVSPFFRSSKRSQEPSSRIGITKQDFRQSASKIYGVVANRPSLNGLSFFNSPIGELSQPVLPRASFSGVRKSFGCLGYNRSLFSSGRRSVRR